MPAPTRTMFKSPLDTSSTRHRLKIDAPSTSSVCTAAELAEPWAFSALLPQLREAFPKPPLATRSPCLGFTFATSLHSPKSQSKKALERLRTQLKLQFKSQNWLRPQRCSSPNPFHLTSRNSEFNKAQWLAKVAQQATGGTGMRANPTPLAREAPKASFSLAHELPALNDCWTR